MKLQRLWNNRKYIARWLFVDTWQAWSALLPVGLGLWALAAQSEFFLKLLGLGLQLAGVCVAALGVRSIMRLFQLDGARTRFSKWWARRPFATQHVAMGALTGAYSTMGGTVSHGIQKIDPAEALPDQVAKLIKNQQAMYVNAVAMQDHVSELESRLAASLQSEETARAEQLKEMLQLMKQATVGSPMVALLGLYWIALGLVMATVPQELLCWCMNP